LGGGRGVVLLGGQLGHDASVVEHPPDLGDRLEDGLQPLELLDGGLRRLLVGPETGGGHLLFDLGQGDLFAGDVKESPGARSGAR
jgi:hypothetical protein